MEELRDASGELDILRADYEFLVLRLCNLVQSQCHFFEDFFVDMMPIDFSEELKRDANYLEKLIDFELPDKLENFTSGLVHELYNIQNYLVPEQEQHMVEVWKTAGNLETFFKFLAKMIDLKSFKYDVEKTFLEEFEKERDRVSVNALEELGLLIGSQYDGSAFHSLLDQNYPKDVDVQKVIQLREQVLNSQFRFKPIA